MIGLAERLWAFFLGAALLGLVLTLVLGAGRVSLSSRPLLPLAAGCLVAALGLVGGRPGLWLEIACALGLAYAAGCATGGAIRMGFGRLRRRAVDSGPPPPYPAAIAAATGPETPA